MLSALERLRGIRQEQAAKEPAKPSPKSPKTSGVTLGEFAQSGRTVQIYSAVLGEEVLLAADNARIPDGEARPVYRARELSVIWGEENDMSDEGLRLLHEVKMRFGGEVESEEGTDHA